MGHEAHGRKPRRDAAENTERLLAAAIRAGLNEGRHVPLAHVAAEAGVGVGTLYRRYSNREALLEALQVRAYRLLIARAESAHESGATGLDAIDRFLVGSFEVRDELVLPLHGAPWTADSESARLREALRELMTRMVDRGHVDGSVRRDVNAQIVVRFGAMLAHPMTSVDGWEQVAADQRAIFLRGISSATD